MAAAAKSRQPRLRASCDGCFLAKVKCSKARPLCSRCLACGIDCRYSPSSRAGKPKAVQQVSRRQSLPAPQHTLHHPSFYNYAALAQIPAEVMFQNSHGWMSPPSSLDGTMSRNPSFCSNLSHFGTDTTLMVEGDLAASAGMDPFSIPLDWSQSSDMACQIHISTSPLSPAGALPPSLDRSMITSPTWAEALSVNTMGFGMAAAHIPAYGSTPPPSATQQSFPTRKSASPVHSSASCNCFTACLQTLQALHNASFPAPIPSFDEVLSLNGKAVEGCAAMLSCVRCMSSSSMQTSAMLLATIIGKITSFYKGASAAYFESGPTSQDRSCNSHSISYGVYQLNGEDGKWFELEVLSRELRKLDEVYARFREICSDFTEDAEVNKAMIDYLGQDLASAFEVVSSRRGGQGLTFPC